jgi:hypothetical protein
MQSAMAAMNMRRGACAKMSCRCADRSTRNRQSQLERSQCWDWIIIMGTADKSTWVTKRRRSSTAGSICAPSLAGQQQSCEVAAPCLLNAPGRPGRQACVELDVRDRLQFRR